MRDLLLNELERYCPELTRDQIDERTREWRTVPYLYHGKVAGCGAMCGVEIHFFITPEYQGRALQRRALRAFLTPLLAQCGILVTRVPHGSKSDDFVRRIGFRPCGGDDHAQYWMLTEVKF